MREDQFLKLQALQEKLADAALMECDPDNWSGGDKLPKELTKEERGDRYWCKKNAAASLTLLNKTLSLAHWEARTPVQPNEPAKTEDDTTEEDDLDAAIAAANKKSEKLLHKFEKRKGLQVVK